jgi:hypothetical protein
MEIDFASSLLLSDVKVELKSVPDCRLVVLKCTRKEAGDLFAIVRCDWVAYFIQIRKVRIINLQKVSSG